MLKHLSKAKIITKKSLEEAYGELELILDDMERARFLKHTYATVKFKDLNWQSGQIINRL